MKRRIIPNYYPPVELLYAEVPEGHEYRIAPAPHQRIGKKEERLWGATLSQVPYAYEDPYLRSAQDIIYQADTSHMHRYPYVNEWEDLGRPDMFDEPFPTGSANYMDTYGEDEFGKIGDGKLFAKAKELKLGKKIKGAVKSKKGKGLVKGIIKRREERRGKPKRNFAALDLTPAKSLLAQQAELDALPEPALTSNLFFQIAENEKVSLLSRLEAGSQIPLTINDNSMQLIKQEGELTDRAAIIQKIEEDKEKSESKNRVLLYTTVGSTFALATLIVSKLFGSKKN